MGRPTPDPNQNRSEEYEDIFSDIEWEPRQRRNPGTNEGNPRDRQMPDFTRRARPKSQTQEIDLPPEAYAPRLTQEARQQAAVPSDYEDFNTRRERERPPRPPKKPGGCMKRGIALFLVLVLLVVGGAGVYGYSLLGKMNSNVGGHAKNLYVDESTLRHDKNVINILLLGVDRRKKEQKTYRSDTMLLFTIDKQNKKIKLTSFLRDSWVYIPDHDHQRLNAACSYGGYQLVMDTIEYNFGIQIDHYAMVDFDVFEKIVDTLGGINTEVTEKESKFMKKDKYDIPAGKDVHLNGKEALWYCRIRKLDSDFMRTQRQRKVMEAIVNKAKAASLPTQIKVLNQILPMVETDMSKSDLLKLGMGAATTFLKFDIEQFRIPIKDGYTSKTIKGAQVLSLDFTKNKQALEKFLYAKEEPSTTAKQ